MKINVTREYEIHGRTFAHTLEIEDDRHRTDEQILKLADELLSVLQPKPEVQMSGQS